MRSINKLFIRSHGATLLGALGVFVLVASMGEMFLHNLADNAEKEHFSDSLTFVGTVRAKVESELNSLLYLSSGLGSYLVVRNDSLKQKEVNDILSVLHKSNGHIRNFGIAIGYTINYVYPLAGNEGAIGLNYRDHPEQWPMVKKIVDSGAPALAGPVNLVQGGKGLIYRVPLFIDKKYWGLLSTVIDLDDFAKEISSGIDHSKFQFAIRGKDGAGAGGDIVIGASSLFDEVGVITQEIDVPGGRWIVAVKILDSAYQNLHSLPIRLIFYTLALIAAWMMYMLIRSRSELADLAMYDQLTGLPNRHLLEDRAEMALARYKRNSRQIYAVIFLDLDGFKDINDQHGHKAGDAILLAVANRASSIMRENDTVARWGGDEFVVLMEDVEEASLKPRIEKLRKEIEKPVIFEGKSLRVGVSIGIAICPKSGGNLEQILKEADQQMYNEKQQRKVS